MIKHIIWDWNGTLFNDVELSVSVMNSILSERLLPTMSIDYYKSIFTFPVIDYYKKLNIDFGKEPFNEIGKLFIDRYEARKHESKLHDGTEELLIYLKNKGISQSILSAYSQTTLEEIISYYKIDSYFNNIVGLNHIYADSKIENGKKLMKRLNHNKHEILFIGDTVHDFEVAEEIGISSVLFSKGHQCLEILKTTGTKIIGDLNEIKIQLEKQ